MAEEELSYEKIREIYQRCKKKEVVKLSPYFYSGAKKYVESLQNELAKENGVLSIKARALSDSINRLSDTIDELYNLREDFVLDAAKIKIRGGEADYIKNFSEDEKSLLNEIVDCLNRARAKAYSDETEEQVEILERKRKDSPVMILEDLQPFVAEDRKEYTLKKGDIVTLPSGAAHVLIKNEKAKMIKG